jgi:hypothetical protein
MSFVHLNLLDIARAYVKRVVSARLEEVIKQ